MDTTNELAGIEKERNDLEQIQARFMELQGAAEEAQKALSVHTERVRYATTPAGLLELNDKEIEAAARALREAQRTAAKADAELKQYAEGPAKNIGERLRENARRKFDAEHAAARKTFFDAVKAQIERLKTAAGAEKELDALARAAGFQRGPIHLPSGEFGQAGGFDLFRRDLCTFHSDLLSPNDPQRRLWEAGR